MDHFTNQKQNREHVAYCPAFRNHLFKIENKGIHFFLKRPSFRDRLFIYNIILYQGMLGRRPFKLKISTHVHSHHIPNFFLFKQNTVERHRPFFIFIYFPLFPFKFSTYYPIGVPSRNGNQNWEKCCETPSSLDFDSTSTYLKIQHVVDFMLIPFVFLLLLCH